VITLVVLLLYAAVAFHVTALVARAFLAHEERAGFYRYSGPDTEDRVLALAIGATAGLVWPVVGVGFVLYSLVFPKEGQQ
jgi:hypothetical protein